jgi:hypothetical protein
VRTIYRNDSETVDVAAYVGPVRPDGGFRRRYQVTVISDQDGKHHSASLSYEEFHALRLALAHAT